MAEIKKIILELKGKEIILSIDDARELKNVLVNLLGGDKYCNHFYQTNVPSWGVYTSGAVTNLTYTGANNAICL